jgi:hypothetical protein
MKRSKVVTVLVLAISASIISGCKPKIDKNNPGAVLLEQRCFRCHPTGIKQDGRDMVAWAQTVDRMVAKGAVLNGEEKQVLVNYLAKEYKP